jgi:acetolactate decarboxylase
MNGVDPAGYHLHIITNDKTAGGHLLECQIENASIQIEIIKNYMLILP